MSGARPKYSEMVGHNYYLEMVGHNYMFTSFNERRRK